MSPQPTSGPKMRLPLTRPIVALADGFPAKPRSKIDSDFTILLLRFPGSRELLNFTRTQAPQSRDSIPAAAAVPTFLLRSK
jgi:hypothetical protein